MNRHVSLPTLVFHIDGWICGQKQRLRAACFQCAVKAPFVGIDDKDEGKDRDGCIDYMNSTNNYTKVAIGWCASQTFWVYC
jgi:hypothetical protein